MCKSLNDPQNSNNIKVNNCRNSECYNTNTDDTHYNIADLLLVVFSGRKLKKGSPNDIQTSIIYKKQQVDANNK